MGKLNINVRKEVNDRFRKEVFNRKGLKKGNLKEAVEEAMILWIDTTATQRAIKAKNEKRS